MNKVIIVGNLGADPELKHTATGQAVANFTLATNEQWTDKEGAKQERTEWHRIVVWGKQAENCEKYLKKGRQALVEGKIQTREWEDKDGTKRWTTEIVAQNVQFLGAKGDSPASGGGGGGGRSQEASNESFNDDDIPFIFVLPLLAFTDILVQNFGWLMT